MYYVMRTEKRKRSDISGLQAECNRTLQDDRYNNKVDIGMDFLNINLKYSNNWLKDINSVIDSYNIRARSNAVIGLDTIYTASPEFFNQVTQETALKFFQKCVEFHQKRYGIIVSAVIHYDESTPHLHIMSVPITNDGRLSARDIIGNKKCMSDAQTAFFEEVGKLYNLERGEIRNSSNKRQHITAQEHRIAENNRALRKQERQLERLERKLSNSSKQIEEAQRKLDNINCKISDRENFLDIVNLNINSQRKKLKGCMERLKGLQGYLTRAESRAVEEILEDRSER